jgi:hypothetical protein
VKSIGIITATALFLLFGIAAPADARQDKQEEKAKPAKQEQPAKPERQQQAKGQQAEHRQPRQQQDNTAKQQEQAKGQQAEQRQQRQQQANSARQQQQEQAKGQQAEQRQQRQQQANSARQQQQEQAATRQDQKRQQRDNVAAQRRSPAQVRQQQVAWRGDRARSWVSEHRTWQQRGGYHGYRIPDDRFRGYYGQDHGFRIYNLPVRYVGGHRRFHYGAYWFGLVDPWPEYWSSDWYDNDDVYVDYYGDGYYLYNRRYPSDRIAISFYLN